MLSAARRRRFTRREVLFHEGDPGDTLHLIDKGRVAIRITTPLGDAATVGVLGRGEVVGEMAILEEGGRRGATVMALEATETLSIDRSAFIELRRRYPGVDLFIFDVLMANVRRVNVQLMEALFVPVDRRATVNRVLRQAEEAGAVSLSRGRIRVTDRALLAKRAR